MRTYFTSVSRISPSSFWNLSLLWKHYVFYYRRIARSAKRRYLSYSEDDFKLFRPTRATCCTDEDKICRGGVYYRSTVSCQIWGGYKSPQMWKFGWNCDISTVFTARRYASAVYAVVVSVCMCLSHASIVSNRLNLWSRKQRRMITQWL